MTRDERGADDVVLPRVFLRPAPCARGHVPGAQRPHAHDGNQIHQIESEGHRPRRQDDPEYRPGLCLVGYFRSEHGVGEAGRQIVRAAHASGLPYCTRLSRNAAQRHQHPFDHRDADEQSVQHRRSVRERRSIPLDAAGAGEQSWARPIHGRCLVLGDAALPSDMD
jgi:hypothetical protein